MKKGNKWWKIGKDKEWTNGEMREWKKEKRWGKTSGKKENKKLWKWIPWGENKSGEWKEVRMIVKKKKDWSEGESKESNKE